MPATRINVLLLLLVALPTHAQVRAPWMTSRVTGSLLPPPAYITTDVFPQLSFEDPVTLTKAPGTPHLFLLQLDGKIFQINLASGDTDLVADLKRQIPGLDQVYGLTFHPRFSENRYCYVCYIRAGDESTGTVVSRFRMTAEDTPQIDPQTEHQVITWRRGGHNGGCIKFGLDGYLYISAGDGGPAFPPDPLRAGQDLCNLLSTIMRIDVDRAEGTHAYAIPAGNPFVDHDGARPEIWAYGFRNPWRMAFDEVTGDLWVGDVGWELWEMIQCVKPGDNYGWSLVEGPHTVHEEGTRGPTPIVPPVAVHSHTEARSISGGQVYHGTRLPELQGAYVYGDHVTGRIWAIHRHADGFTPPEEIARSPLKVICFGTDHDAEVYVVGYGGSIHRLEPNPRRQTNSRFPRTLSQTGIFRSVGEHHLQPGVLSYAVNAEPWMDGAMATRFLGIPGHQQIGVYTTATSNDVWAGRHRGAWRFPQDTVVGKTISWGDRRVETQLLHYDGAEWQPYSYLWNEAQTDAELVEDAPRTVEISVDGKSHSWNVVSRTECLICHSTAAGVLLGFQPSQLNRIHPASGANQLSWLEEVGLLQQPSPRPQPLVDPYDTTADIHLRARSYLHANCAHCHRREGGGAAAMDVRFEQTLARTNLLGQRPTQGTFFIPDPAVVAPGDPYRSVLYYRLAKLGRGRMPYFGSTEPDRRGLTLIHDWIVALGEDAHPEVRVREVVDRLAGSPEEIAAELQTSLQRTRDSLMMSHALAMGHIDGGLKSQVMAAAKRAEPHISDLFERFRPPEERIPRLGTSIKPEQILAVAGDVGRGRKLFLSETLSCKTCHAFQPGQDSMGPNLATLAAAQYRREVILENILEPSRSVSDEYITYLVQTVDGQVHSGILRQQGDEVILRDQRNEEIRIRVADIELRRQQQKSIMPELLLSELTTEQAADLLAFLQSLGGLQRSAE